MKQLILTAMYTFLAVCSMVSADILPVDREIAELMAKARYLNDMKSVLLDNDCSITVGSNKVKLDAGAIRSLKLLMAIGTGFPGQYLAYHKAPKPEMLKGAIEFTLLRAAGTFYLVRADLGYTESTPSHLVVSVGSTAATPGTGLKHPGHWNPFGNRFWAPVFDKGDAPLWDYRMIKTNLEIPERGKSAYVKASTNTGVPFSVSCN